MESAANGIGAAERARLLQAQKAGSVKRRRRCVPERENHYATSRVTRRRRVTMSISAQLHLQNRMSVRQSEHVRREVRECER